MPSKKVMTGLTHRDSLRRLDALDKVAEAAFDQDWWGLVHDIAYRDEYPSVRKVAVFIITFGGDLMDARDTLQRELALAREAFTEDAQVERMAWLESVAEKPFDRAWFDVVNDMAHRDEQQGIRKVAARVISLAQVLLKGREALQELLAIARSVFAEPETEIVPEIEAVEWTVADDDDAQPEDSGDSQPTDHAAAG